MCPCRRLTWVKFKIGKSSVNAGFDTVAHFSCSLTKVNVISQELQQHPRAHVQLPASDLCKQAGSDVHPVQKLRSSCASSLNQAGLCSGSGHHYFLVGLIMCDYWYVASKPRGPLKHEVPQFSNLKKKEGYTIRKRVGKDLRKKGEGQCMFPRRS